MYFINQESMAIAFGVSIEEIENTVTQLAPFFADSDNEPEAISKWSVLAGGGKVMATDVEVKYLPGMCFNDSTPPQPLAPGWEKVATDLIGGDIDTLMEEGS